MADAFNLLQMYQDDDDDDDDDDMEDTSVPESHQTDDVEERHSPLGEPPDSRIEDLNLNDVVTTTNPQRSASSTPKWTNLRPPTPEVGTTGTPGLDFPKPRKDKPAIVDYAHDDVAMSPEPEEGEILGTRTGRVIFGEELGSMRDAEVQQRTVIGNVQSMTPKHVVDSPQLSAQADVPHLDMINNAVKDSDTEVRDGVDVSDESKDIDPLDKFLPPPPQEKCSDELQEKINKFLAYKRQGKSFNVEVRNRKDYRNPDFLRHAVRYQDIDEIGSCFSKDVFDPHGYDESDFYDAIEAAINRERERKEQERKKSQKVEFVSGTTQGGTVGVTPKAMLPSPGVSILPSGGSQSASAESIPREGRHNKKSKWDKVDGDRRSVLGGGHENVSAVGAHAALLSAANAGAGYAVYAQQKRREAEERRSSDRTADKRS